METYFIGGAAVCVAAATGWDLATKRIPNWLVYGGMATALVARAAFSGGRGLGDGVVAGLLGGGIFFLLFLAGGMGGGDVKLVAAVGCWVGLRQLVVVLLAAAIAGGILALGYMVFYRRVRRTAYNLAALLRFHMIFGLQPHPEINLQSPEAVKIPYAVAIAAGTFYAFGVMLVRG